MPKVKSRTYSPYSHEALALLASQIKWKRKAKGWPMQELAERAGTSRGFIQRLESGNPKCEIGLAFEIAHILGISLFNADDERLKIEQNNTKEKIALLPKSTHSSKKKVFDDF